MVGVSLHETLHPEHPMRLLLAFSLVAAVGCQKKPAIDDPVASSAGQAPAKGPATRDEVASQLARNFERVYFEFDSASLNAASKAALAENAGIMAAAPEVRIEVQGHADDRGTTDYNIALGERRAQAVRSLLTSSGVAPSRVTAVSYGEERPVANGAGESIWSQNRRAEFRVVWGEGVAGTTY
jgi:peptidoglycan-associated lipoprotein